MYLEREKLINFLKENGISPSPQRMQIYEYIATHDTHPTADEIYGAVYKKIPSLSKTTVYNTVRVLAEIGLINELTIDGTEIRYDADTRTHAHFKCTQCGRIFDISDGFDGNFSPELGKNELNLEGHTVRFKQLYYYGICRDCRENSN